MARKKKSLVGIVGPVTVGGIRPGSSGRPGWRGVRVGQQEVFDPGTGTVVAPGYVALVSGDPNITFVALLNEDGAVPTAGGPRNDIVERVLRTGVPEYKGHDPVRLSIPLILDNYRSRRSVQPELDMLYRLSKLQPGRSRTPLIRVFGPVPFTHLRWTIDGPIEWDDNPQAIRGPDGTLHRQSITVNLLERVSDSQLARSIAKSRRSGSGARNGPHYTTVRGGENDLGDVSKRLYGTRNRKGELAHANNLSVGARLKKKQRIRVP